MESEGSMQATRMREMLKECGLTQRGAARKLGVNERTMRHWLAGDNAIPKMAFMALETIIKKPVDTNR